MKTKQKNYKLGRKPYFVWSTYVPYMGIKPKQRKINGSYVVELDFSKDER